MAQEINFQIAVNGFFDGCDNTDEIDEMATIDAYADACRDALTTAYPDIEVTVEVNSNLLGNRLHCYDSDGNEDDDLTFFVDARLYDVWNDGTFWVEKVE